MPARNDSAKDLDASPIFIAGLGHVGLTLALACVSVGHKVYGYDVSADLLHSLSSGTAHTEAASSAGVQHALRDGQLTLTLDPSDCQRAKVVIICVPTPLSPVGTPDLSAVQTAAEVMARFARPGTLVILESTVHPGTTEQYVIPAFIKEGRTVGNDIYIAYSPERLDPGNPRFRMGNIPKIVAGATTECTLRARAFYSTIVTEVVTATGIREAEMAKLLENTYRQVNISLVNEMAMVCHSLGIDVWDVIRCAATKPFGYARFDPGPGIGGDCIAVDPIYLNSFVQKQLGRPSRMIEAANAINVEMPGYVVHRTIELLHSFRVPIPGATVLLIGVSYKADISDVRNSPALPVAHELLASGLRVSYLDPHVSSFLVDSLEIERVNLGEDRHFDLVLLLQHHKLVDSNEAAKLGSIVLDTRGVCTAPNAHYL